ncbi:MAG: hypothetical protein KDJ90_06285 [Nitratireductor sp.]|nr:hypothetical protein [Nitratireductor sp.]
MAGAMEGRQMDRSPLSASMLEMNKLLKHSDRIGEEDVRHFRREVFRDGLVSHAEAEAVFSLDGAVPEKCAEWHVFFVEALTDFIVDQAEPRGYVSLSNAEWLIDRVSHDGHLDTLSELELLIKVMSKAQSSPDTLIRFTIGEIARAAIEAEGPLARGRQLKKGVIDEAEVEIIRAVLYAFGGEAGISISRPEAEVLFELNDRTVEAENHPAWQELFVKAIANYLMAAASYRAPSRVVALAREDWLEDSDADLASTVRGVFSGFGQLFAGVFFDEVTSAHEQMEKAWAERNRRVAAAEAEAERIEDGEADWLIDRLSNDGLIHANEKALLRFIRDESPDIHPRLKPWLDKVA